MADPTDTTDDPRRWAILAVLCLSLLIVGIDGTIVNIALPSLVRELGASSSQLQWIVDAYTLLFASFLLLAGGLGDRYGRKTALTVGLVIFGLGSLASALVGSPDALIATRALQGFGAAAIMPSTLSILTNVFSAEERPRAIGIWAGVSGWVWLSVRSPAATCSSTSGGARSFWSTSRSSSWPWRREQSCSPTRGTPRLRRSTTSVPVCRSPCWRRSSTRSSRAPPKGGRRR